MTELLTEGASLMVVGMGAVFVLLTALVFIVHGVSKLSRALTPAAQPARPASHGPAAEADEELVSAVSAAIRLHRRRRDDP